MTNKQVFYFRFSICLANSLQVISMPFCLCFGTHSTPPYLLLQYPLNVLNFVFGFVRSLFGFTRTIPNRTLTHCIRRRGNAENERKGGLAISCFDKVTRPQQMLRRRGNRFRFRVHATDNRPGGDGRIARAATTRGVRLARAGSGARSPASRRSFATIFSARDRRGPSESGASAAGGPKPRRARS